VAISCPLRQRKTHINKCVGAVAIITRRPISSANLKNASSFDLAPIAAVSPAKSETNNAMHIAKLT
jgi:hypothetical protein